MNRKAQLGGLFAFIMVVVVMIMIAPIILKVAISIFDKTSTQFATIDATNKSADLVLNVKGKLTSTFDWVIMFLIVLNILVLLITSFLIDVHPAFLIIYIIGAFILVITAPYSIAAAEKIYGMTDFSTGDNVIQYIPMTEFVLNNFGVIIVGVIVLTGIIMYSKIKLFSSGGSSGGSY